MERIAKNNASGFLYMASLVVTLGGCVYASVPLYRIICQTTGFGGTPASNAHTPLGPGKKEALKPVAGSKFVRITFTADCNRKLPWSFRPEQRSLIVRPGQTALAFYKATNHGDREITGLATYNIIPARAAPYFNKIQCFCFEQQRLSPGEQVDMPVFFYLDQDYAHDPTLHSVEEIILSYTFFEAKET